jgi:hypothetical protein
MKKPALLRTLFLAPLLLCAINAVVVCSTGGYDLSLGPMHLGSHSPFKAILQMEGAFLFALIGLGLLSPAESALPSASSHRLGFYAWLALLITLVGAAYAPSLAVNFQYQDWDFRLASSAIHSLHDTVELFTKPQADGFYRPMTFLALLVDDRVFGNHAWGYHLQNIAFHIANCILFLILARTLGFAESVARWAAVLFAVAAVNFEPVLWPAARFDLTATACTLLAIIFALRYLDGASASTPAFSAIAFALGILNKESAYCLPLVLGCLILFWRKWPVSRVLRLAAVTFLVIAVMILIRLAVLRGVGGYPGSPHYAFTLKTLISLFTRLPVGLFGVNSSVAPPFWLIASIATLGGVMIAAVIAGARVSRPDLVLLLCALLTALPTLNIINWIGEPMQQARYLYMPGIWLCLFVASVMSTRKSAIPLLALWAAANLAGLEHNLNVYRTTLAKTEVIAERVRRDASPGVRTILIRDLPDQPNGVFFASSELITQIKSAIPDAVIFRDNNEACPDLAYRWNPSTTDLVREPMPAFCPSPP